LNCSRGDIRGLKLNAIRKLLTLCRAKPFEIVICHRYKPTYIMLCVAQFIRIRSLFFVMHAMGTMQSMARRLQIAALARPNMTFAGVSDAVRDDLRQALWRVPAERIITLHNIIDHALFEPQFLPRNAARAELKLANTAFVFGHIGRLVKEKDQKTLLSAFALAKPHCPNAKLVIMGDGRLEADLKQQTVALQLEEDVLFTGFIQDGFRFMKAFDVNVLCSIKEAFGRVTLEAMVARVPTIATRVYGIPEVVGDSGFLIDPSNPEQLAAQMIALYQAPVATLQHYGEKGYQRMRTHFSIDSFKTYFSSLIPT
jgi:glycosyltransferase involved in cell wall biosynthesis